MQTRLLWTEFITKYTMTDEVNPIKDYLFEHIEKSNSIENLIHEKNHYCFLTIIFYYFLGVIFVICYYFDPKLFLFCLNLINYFTKSLTESHTLVYYHLYSCNNNNILNKFSKTRL